MSFKIKARISTSKGVHDLTLPQSQNEFDESLRNAGLDYWNNFEYKIENASSGNPKLDKSLAYSSDIEELNFLAQILSHLNDDELEKFDDILKAEGNIPTMTQVINMAYNVNNSDFNIENSVYDVGDLGRMYAEENDILCDETILNNTDENGEIDYEGIGVYLQISQGGVFCDSGYVANFDEMTSKPYDGRFFPSFCYNDNNDNAHILGVKLTKWGEEKGVDVFLPAEVGVKHRAKKRLGTRLDNCILKPCWGFPLSLADKTFHASELDDLSTIATRLSVLKTYQLREVFDAMENTNIVTLEQFDEFCAEKIRQIQMPEAVNNLTYYFPLEVKMCDRSDPEDDDMDFIGTMSSSDAVFYKDEIVEQIAIDNATFDTNRLLAEYIDEKSSLHQKVYSMLPAVEVHGGELWGAMCMKVAGNLTKDEVAELREYITGQNSDGYGEGLEQREIKVDNGEIYVSFWARWKHYTIYTQEEFEQKLAIKQAVSNNQKINNLPDCAMIGTDSNVFNLIGIVSRTLKDNDLYDQASEMRKRVTSCKSYDEALAIMTEYVNPVTLEETRQSSGFDMKMQ